jgi:hypothetical protein
VARALLPAKSNHERGSDPNEDLPNDFRCPFWLVRHYRQSRAGVPAPHNQNSAVLTFSMCRKPSVANAASAIRVPL